MYGGPTCQKCAYQSKAVQVGCYECLGYGVDAEDCLQCVSKGTEETRGSCYQCLRTGAPPGACGACTNLDGEFVNMRPGCIECAGTPSVIAAGASDACIQCSNAGPVAQQACNQCMAAHPAWSAACVQCVTKPDEDGRDTCYRCLDLLQPSDQPWRCTE